MKPTMTVHNEYEANAAANGGHVGTSPLQEQDMSPTRNQNDDAVLYNAEEQAVAAADDVSITTAPTSRNVPLVLAFTFAAFASQSVWSYNVVSVLVYLICANNPEMVGLLTAILGTMQLLVSFPAGVLADRHRRDFVLRLAAVVGFAAGTVTFWSSRRASLVGLGVGMGLWGAFWGLANTSIDALFTDSTPTAERSMHFTRRSTLQQLGCVSGPCVALIMFATIGNTWDVAECATVISLGQVLFLPALLLLFGLSDENTISQDEQPTDSGSNEETLAETDHDDDEQEDTADDAFSSEPSTSRSIATNGHCVLDTSKALSAPLLENSHLESEEQPDPLPAASCSEEGEAVHNTSGSCFCIPQRRIVPTMIAIADASAGLAAGMSIRYFPIFFLDRLHLSPVIVQVLYGITPLGLAAGLQVAQWACQYLGRLPTVVLFKWTGVSFLLAMLLTYKMGAPPVVVCIIYVIRTVLINSTGAVTRSVLMEHVPKNERAKWSALESVNTFSWSGSAAIGGILVKVRGILFNFGLTGCLQLVATLPLIFLIRHMPKDEPQEEQQRRRSTLRQS